MIDLEPLLIELSPRSTVKITDLAPVGSMTLLGDPHAAGEPDSVKTAPPTRRPAGGRGHHRSGTGEARSGQSGALAAARATSRLTCARTALAVPGLA